MKCFSLKSFKLLFCFVFIGLFSFNAYALRCGNSLVEVGDSYDRVREICGEPDRQREWTVTSRLWRQNVYVDVQMAELIYSKPVGSGYDVLLFRDYKLISIDFER